MSKLRKHLKMARREYETAHYPGDLAADVLRPARQWGRWVGLAGTLAAAAAVALVIFLHRAQRPAGDEIVIQTNIVEPDVIEIAPALSLSEMGSEEALSLPASDFSFSMPTITFVDNETSQDSSTTREAA
jgi:hypothetical protein